ncbi:hypothetical protein IRJ41_011403 [Triplophysa rosa]|uniref:Uncharacterized protein n=1 Tax=Triplophysa rosa TaxID=992332 RepID=A0A9W8C8S5_TRIRA|nr:hypothetical protein IRJ41_011403 [Triplophysa rosa]
MSSFKIPEDTAERESQTSSAACSHHSDFLSLEYCSVLFDATSTSVRFKCKNTKQNIICTQLVGTARGTHKHLSAPTLSHFVKCNAKKITKLRILSECSLTQSMLGNRNHLDMSYRSNNTTGADTKLLLCQDSTLSTVCVNKICQLKKEVALLEEKLRTRGDELNTEDTVCDSNHTLNQDESTDQTSTESLDSIEICSIMQCMSLLDKCVCQMHKCKFPILTNTHMKILCSYKVWSFKTSLTCAPKNLEFWGQLLCDALNVECSSFEESKSDEENTLYADKSAERSADDSRPNSDSDENLSTNTQNPQPKNPTTTSAFSKPSKSVPQPTYCLSTKQDTISDNSSSARDITCDDDHDTTPTECADIDRKDTFSTHKNYCYVCKKPQSKIARHFQKHQDTETEIAAAFALPKHSKDRKRLLEKLRNRGNYEHNQEVMTNKNGPLKVRRRPVRSEIGLRTETYVHCVYCRGLFVRKELWRHTRRCPSKIFSESEATGKANVLVLADIAESTFSQAISPEVCEMLADMKNDDISSVVRNDFLILQLSQCLYNRHRSDPTKSEYIRQKVREMGRLLLSLRRKFSIFSFEDAVKPNSFYKVIEAVKDVSGYDEKSHSYKTPSLALKLGHSLNNIGDIILCRAIAAEDDDMTRAAERFKRLCSSEWAECVSNAALAALSKSKFNKPSTLPFTQDVQLLNRYLEEKSADAFDSLKNHESTQTYEELAKLTLARVIIFNRRRVGEVSKMTVECFMKRHQTELNQDIALSLSPFEQKMSKRFSRLEIMDKRGRKVAVLLNPELVRAMQLILDKRDACDVDKDNPFLFGRPKCSATSFFNGQDCIRLFVHLCGAQNPEDFMSAQLCKQVATMSQILSLKDNELDQLASFLSLDIRLHRDDYRLPDATLEIAKISKLLLAMEKGTLATFQGKSLDEIEIEDEIDLELDEEEISDEDNEESDSFHGVMGNKRRMESTQDEAESSNGIYTVYLYI